MAPQKRKKPLKIAENQISFLCFRLPCPDPALFRRHLLTLVVLSIFTKLLVSFLTTSVFSSFIDYFDIGYYLKDATQIWMGKIPYVHFAYYYPPLSLVSVLLPLIIALLFNSPIYILTHQILMCFFDIGTTLLVYLVALRFYDQKRAFICGFLSATAISAAYFVLTKYDAFPTFLLILSLALFIYGREAAGYAFSAIGFLVKWFPVVAYPYYLVYEHLQGKETRLLARRVLIGAVLVLVITLPFIVLSPVGFLNSYILNVERTQAQSIVFYLDYIANSLGGPSFFGSIIVPVMALIQLGLLAIYWRVGSKDLRVLCSFIFFAVVLVMVSNHVSSPQYIVWVTPFLALLLAGSLKSILLFYAYQVWVYLEFPLMFQILYTNSAYTQSPALFGIPGGFFFFTVKFALLAMILWIVGREVYRITKPERGN